MDASELEYTVIPDASGVRQMGELSLVPEAIVSEKATGSSTKSTVVEDKSDADTGVLLWAHDIRSREHMEKTEVVKSIFFI